MEIMQIVGLVVAVALTVLLIVMVRKRKSGE